MATQVFRGSQASMFMYTSRLATSKDPKAWKGHGSILNMQDGVDPESPTLIRYDDTFYLFVCGWNGIWDRKDLQRAYQHVTCVYQSDDPLQFDANREFTQLDAHAPEIIQDQDGNWFLSSAEWPHRGVSVARLVWEESAPAKELNQHDEVCGGGTGKEESRLVLADPQFMNKR